jgi:hypothetical protein
MKKVLIFALSLLFLIQFVSAQEINKMAKDPKTEKMLLSGLCDRDGLMEGEFGKFYDQYYTSYKTDKKVVKDIKQKYQGVSIVIILGTWCHDSKEQVPRFYKILDMAKWDMSMIEQYCVNTSKLAEGIDISEYNIEKVPTFIFYKDGKELGRIIETPVTTLEKDILLIIEG